METPKIYKLQRCDSSLKPTSEPEYFQDSVSSFFALNELPYMMNGREVTLQDIEKAADENGWTWKTTFSITHPANPFFGFEESTDYYYIVPLNIRR